jgi:hypothetical protein
MRVLEGRDRGAQPVVRQVRRDGDHRQGSPRGGVLRHVERAAATDSHHGVVPSLAEHGLELAGRGEARVLDLEDGRVRERPLDPLPDLLALRGADRHQDGPGAGDVPLVEQRREPLHRTLANVHEQRAREHPG